MSRFNRRRFIASTLALGAALPRPAGAQAFPSRIITLTTTFPGGSPQDLLLRAMGEIVAAEFKQPVVLDNKPGGGGVPSLSFTASQKPDGHALNAVTSPVLTNLPQMQKLPFDPMRDFDFLMRIGSFPIGVVVKAESPFKTWADLVAFAKANPGKITYATPGTASMANLGMLRLQNLAGISLTHVPHRGAMEIIPALLGDHVMVMVTGLEWKPMVEAGKMRLLMMWTETRLPAFRDAPTARELGYPYELDVSFGLLVPKGLPPDVAARLHDAFKAALDTASIRELMGKYDIAPAYLDGAAFKAHMIRVAADMRPVIEQLGLLKKD